ncbi:MAG: hypothetical protein AB1631_23180 [Acidobacteriota bacterium]
MKKTFAFAALAILLAASARANQTDQQSRSSADARAQAEAKSRAEIKSQSDEVTLDAGSRIQADMDSTLDLRKARPGDSFRMKTSRPVKRDGKEVISRGSTITGHVEQVTRAEGHTQATLVFDQIQDKKTRATASIQAVVKAILKAEQQPPMMDDQTEIRRPTSRQQSSGGLVGGVVNTVGGVAGQVNSTVNSTVGAEAGAGNAVGSLGRGAIQIVTDTTATVTTGSTLALSNRRPRIESGTRFILETTSALTLATPAKEKKN